MSNNSVRACFAKDQTRPSTEQLLRKYWLPSSKFPHVCGPLLVLLATAWHLPFLCSLIGCCRYAVSHHIWQRLDQSAPAPTGLVDAQEVLRKTKIGPPSHRRYKTIHTSATELSASAVNSQYPWDFSGKSKYCLALLVVFPFFYYEPFQGWTESSG